MKNRISVIWIFCCSFLCLILGRATYLQVWTHFNDDHKLKKLSNNQFNSRVILRPKRGEIFDRNFESLVVNDEVQSLAANPNGLQKIKKEHWVARQLSHALSLPLASLQLKVKSDKNFVWIKRHLTPADLQALSRAGLRDRKNEFIDGLWLVKETQRNYPQGTLARAILGKVNVDGEGIDGIELQSNSTLAGKTVSLKATRDALGRPTYVESSALEDTEVIHGLPLTLTLDSALQFAVEEELRTAIQKYKARGGMVLVMNSTNGEILAAANQDTTKFQLVTDAYEPGSTIKSILLVGALSNGMKLTDQFDGEHGSIVVQGKRISEAESHERYSKISLQKMLQVSSNVVAAKLAMHLGSKVVSDTYKKFGLTQKTGIQFPGEISGRLPPALKPVVQNNKKNQKKKIPPTPVLSAGQFWKPLTLANLGFGQGLMVTPIQMLRAYGAFANGGYLVEPTLYVNQDKSTNVVIKNKILEPGVVSQMVKALHSVTEKDGTGIKATIEGVEIAGKTGTAQLVDPITKKYSKNRFLSSFIGFPLKMNPQVVILTVLDSPQGVYYASETAAPLFKQVLLSVMNRYEIYTNEKQLTKNDKTSDQIVLSKSSSLLNAPQVANTPHPSGTQGPQPLDQMPDLKGLTMREALRRLAPYDFKVDTKGVGFIHEQYPPVGVKVKSGDSVRLLLSKNY